MNIKAVFFDLDGTLLPLNTDELAKNYFSRLISYMARSGYDAEIFKRGIMHGIGAMMKNDGSRLNEAAFWKAFTDITGEVTEDKLAAFDSFYRDEFCKVKEVCSFAPEAGRIVHELNARGLKVVIATQPAFPRTATEQRIAWAGIDISEVALVTTFENSRFCKPNIKYYEEILQKIGVSAENALMVGNDADEDMVAEDIGMNVFLLTDNLINKSGKDISHYNKGGFAELQKFLQH